MINGQFEDCQGYEYYIKSQLMENFKLKYDTDDSGEKGNIARIAVRKRVNLAKLIKYREEIKYEPSITKKQTQEETAEEGKWKVKVEKGFKMGTTKWYRGDGSVCSNEKSHRALNNK